MTTEVCRLDNDRLQSVLDSLDEGVLTLDDDGVVIGINRAACEILDVQRREALDRGCPCLLGDEVCDEDSSLRRSIADRRPIRHLEIEIVTEAGHRRVLHVRTTVLRGGEREPEGGLVVFRDVSELARLRRDLNERYRLHNLVGKSKPVQEIFRLIEQVADSEASVLIEGDTGTGKELVARAIHHLSPRSGRPFVAVNCAALPESLLESELFGHVRGAFTGALRDKVGRFEAASGGTIFLDEIGEISPTIQVKLLRVLQEHRIERVGAEQSTRVDIRVIAAANQSLTALVQQRRFREDLLYRLRVVPITLPPLRERRDDIPLLAQHFVEHLRRRTGRPITGLEDGALGALVDYDWPGNVRQLENAIEYAFVKAYEGQLAREHLPPEIQVGAANVAPRRDPGQDLPGRGRARLARRDLQQVLHDTSWNISRAARRLGISRTTLYTRMREFGIVPPERPTD